MSARCPICSHDSRAAIEQAIMNGKPKAQIAKTFGFTYHDKRSGKDVGDHKKIDKHIPHMGDAVAKALESRELASGESIVARLNYLDSVVDAVIERNQDGTTVYGTSGVPLLDEQTGEPRKLYDERTLLAAVREGRRNAELKARLAGKVEVGPEDLDEARKRLSSPNARRLLAELEEEMAAAEAEEA